MSKFKFTKSSVASLPPTTKPSLHWDTELQGLGLRQQPSGKTTYIVEGRIKGIGQTFRMSLGTTDVLLPPKAREEARQILAKAARGEDPRVKIVSSDKVTVQQICEEWLEKVAPYNRRTGLKINPDNLQSIVGRVRNHIIPTLGKISFSELKKVM